MKRVFQKLSILLALMAGIWCFSSCNELNNGTGGGINSYSVTIYVYENNTISPITIPVEEGSTLNSLTGDLYTTPTYKDYEFEGFVTEDGSTFTASTPVTKDIVLYAKFKKTAQNNEGTTSTTTTETKITDGSSSTSTQTTTYENGAQTVETSTTTENKDGSKTEVESTSTTNYQTGETTSTTTETVTSKDGTSKTTETKESSSTDESGNFVKTTETSVTETIDGKSQTTTEKVEVTENAETGDVTTKTTTTDSNGKTETKEDTTTYNDKQAHYWIMKGINELLKFQQAGSYNGYLDYIVEAKKDFAKAYEVEPTSDEAKVYSAINDWTDMVTNPAIAKFLSEHLGVTNYPDNFKDVLSGEWLAEDSYVMGSGSRYWSGYTISEVTNPDSDYFYDYYVKCSSTDAEGDFSTSDYYLKTTIPNTNNVYVDQNTEDAYNYCKDGFESVIFGSVNPNLPYYRTEAKNFVLDANGDYLVGYWYAQDAINQLTSEEKAAIKYYSGSWTSGYYYYPIKMKTPKMNILNGKDDGWYSEKLGQMTNFWAIFAANALNGNTNGLNDAIDDLYSVIFEGDAYKSACQKINAVTSNVKLPAVLVKATGLDRVYGASDVIVGKAELKLIESVFNAVKGVFEYVQAYSFDTDLSCIKDGYASMFTGDMAGLMSWVKDNFGEYNKDVDPIANNFLTVRNADKTTASKNTLISVIDDAVAAYDAITAVDGKYPEMVTDTIKSQAWLYEAALALKTAMKNGTKFYIPTKWPIESWPSKADTWLDMGKIFSSGIFVRDRLIEIDNGKPVLYMVTTTNTPVTTQTEYGTSTTYKPTIVKEKITSKEKLLEFAQKQGGYDQTTQTSTYYTITLNNSGFWDVIESIQSFGTPRQGYYKESLNYGCAFPAQIGLFIYNFYYGGLSDVLFASTAQAATGE